MTGLMAVWLPGPAVQGATGIWILDANGNWTGTPANWQAGTIPNAIGDTAIFRNNITGNRTVTLNSAITLGALQMGDSLGANTFTFAGTNALTLDNTTGNATVSKFNSTTDIWQAPLVLTDNVDWNIFSGVLQVNGAANAQVSYTGAGNTIKNGAGVLQLNRTGTYTGNWIVNLGTLNIGGANGAASTNLGTGANIILNGNGRQDLAVFALNNNGTGTGTTVTYAGNNDVIVQGGASINAERNFIGGANDRVNHVLDTLTMNGGILRVNSGNSHTLTFAGTTTLVGETSVFEPLGNGTPTLANLTLSGAITDGAASRSLIKEGAGRLLIQSLGNSYDGVTAIKDGVLQLAAGANLGAGMTYINGGALSVPDMATLDNLSGAGGLTLVAQMGTTRFALPVVGYSGGAAIDGANPLSVNVPTAGMILGIDGVTGTASTNAANIDLSQVASGNNRVWVGNVIGFDRTYTGTLTNGTSGDLRLTSGSNVLIIATTANALGGAAATNNLVFGYDHNNPIVFTGNNITHANTGTVSVRVNNANTLGSVTVNRGITANINGTITTPLGAGVVTALGGTISTDNTSAAQFGNTDFRLFGGSTLLLDNRAVTAASTNRRLLPATNIQSVSSVLSFAADGGAAGSGVQAQTIDDYTYSGGNFINIGRDGATAGTRADLTVTNGLTRDSRGTIVLGQLDAQAATLGTASATSRILLTAAPTVTNGMIGADIALLGGANMQDTFLPSFVTYDGTNGIQARAFDLSGTAVDSAAELAAATSSQVVSIDTTSFTVTTGNVQALRVRRTAAGGTLTGGTITIGASAASGQGAGLYLTNNDGNTGATHSTNFAFGTQEALIYAATSGSSTITLSGVLSGTNGVTRFGPGILSLTGTNTFTGPLTINSGETRLNRNAVGNVTAAAGTINPGTAGEINLWGGSLYLSETNQRLNANLNFYNDARFGDVNVAGSALNNITVQARTGSTAPVVAWFQDQAGGQFSTAYGGLVLNGPAQLSVVHPVQINGAISGTGTLERFMNDRLYVGGDSSGYSAAVTAWAGSLQSLNAGTTVKPFGTGTITLNPGSMMRIAAPGNIAGGQLTINSDHGGISGLGQTYNADPATTLPSITVNSTAPWKAFFGVGSYGAGYNFDQSTATGLWGGNVYLGAVHGDTGVFTGTLTPSDAGQFLLGGGQGLIRVDRALSGSNAAVIGVSMTGDQQRADQSVNNLAQGSGVVQFDVPMTYTGNTILNSGILRIAHYDALDATGDIIANGGQLRTTTESGRYRFMPDVTIANDIKMKGNFSIQTENLPYDMVLGGDLALSTDAATIGAVRTLTIGVDGNNSGNVILTGGITDGLGSGNHFVKDGYGTLFLRGTNNFTGSLTVVGGLLGVNSDADFGNASQILLPGGGLGVFENSFTSSRNISFHGGNGWFDVNAGLTFTQAASSTYDGTSFIMKRGLGTVVLNGTNAQTGILVADGILQINSQDSIGNMAETGADRFQFGGDFSPGGGTASRHLGGTLRINFTGASNRGLSFNNNGSTNTAGGIDITSGNTFTLNGVVQQGTEFDHWFKSGAGTLITTGTNTARRLAVVNGTLQFGNSAPWANNITTGTSTEIQMLGGTIHAINTGADIAVANGVGGTTNYNYGGGMHLRMTSGAGFEVTFDADSLLRQNQGTLVLETGAGTTLGGAVNTNAGRLLVTEAINSGVARASALTNGIFAAHLIGADSAGTAFFLQNDATNGFVQYAGATTATLSGLNPTGIGEIVADPALTGSNNSIYAFRTTSDISGGTLKITAIDNLRSGGVLINGSNTISSNLVFDPTSATAPGTGTPSEGLVYVKTGETGTISGAVTANAFTKFGDGTLVLSGTNMIAGDVSVQDGTLRLNGGSPFSRLNTELNINGGATLDLNGTSIAVETLGSNNRLVDTAVVGGQVTNTSGTQAVLSVAGGTTNATAWTGTINGNLKLLKAGTGTLNIDGYRPSTPDSGNNTFTGGTDLYGYNTTGGINLNNATTGLGGFGGASGDVNLYSGTLGLLYSGNFLGVPTGSAPRYSGLNVVFGQDGTTGYTVNVKGPSLINVNQVAGAGIGQSNVMQIGALNMTNSTLQLSGGNFYRLGVSGTTTIQGLSATFQTNNDSTAIQFDGLVTGSGAINKTGDGALRSLIFNNTGNNFSGGLNIQGGDVINPNASANTLGSGPVRVFPDGSLRIAGNSSVIGANLQTLSRVNSMGAIVLHENFNPTVLTSSNFSSAYNVTLQIGSQMFSQALDMATIGDGRAFLGNGTAIEARYLAPTLGAGVADAWNPGVGVYRIAGGTSTLSFEGPNNVLTGTAYLQAGPQRNMVLGAVGNGGSTIAIRNSNNYSGGTQIAEGITLIAQTGGSPIGETPLGSGAVEVYGTLQFSGSLGSNWKADTSSATNTINLRPGGLVYLVDGNTVGSGGNHVAGDQGRWGDAVGIDLNGGTFRFDGAANWNSFETIGTVDVRKGSGLQVFRSQTSSSAQLTVGGLNRIAGGTLAISYNTGFLGTNLTTPMSYERLLVTGGVTLTGTTNNGATVVNSGIAPVWIVDATTNTYLGYNPTNTGTGFQPLRTDATAPGAGELSYSTVGTTLPAGTGAETVNLTGAATLGAAATSNVWALRATNNIANTGAGGGTITTQSGGLLLTGGTINAALNGVVQPMTINFGAAGAGEALIYTGGNATMQAQMVAAQGLTKFGGSILTINSINPGIGGPVTINAGTIVARVPFSGTGTAITDGVFNGQDVILNGGALQLDPFLANAGQTATEIASNIRATAVFNSNIFVRGDSSLNNNGVANYVRIQNLTFENAGGASAMNDNGVITLALQNGIWVNGTTTLIPQAAFNMTFNNFAQSTFAGQVTGTADLEKFGNGTMTFLNGTNNYSGGTLIHGTTNATAASIVASGFRGTGTPFGTGAITVNPGGLLRIVDNDNIGSNAVTLKSDGIGLAGIGIGHNGALPTIITSGTPTAGQVKIESTGPYGGVIGLDYGYYSQDINLASIGNGDWWLGGSLSTDTFYFNDSLGANSNSRYQLGGGGNQSSVNFGSVLVSGNRTPLFENIFSGGTASTVRVEVGALTADLFANGPSFVNGNVGTVVMATRNTTLVGDVRVNTSSTLALGNSHALGAGRLVMNGGNLRYDFGPNNYLTSNITLDSNVLLLGDWSTSSGNELVLNGNVAMHDGSAGATRIWNMTGTAAMAVGLTAGSTTNGVISGADGSNLIKRGAQTVSFRGANSYQGYTQIDRGEINVVGNVLPGVNGPLGNSNSPIVLGVESTNNAGSLGIGGKYTVGRDIVVSAAPGTGINLIQARTNERAILTGGISIASGAILTLGSQSGNNANSTSGGLEIQGPISGPGAVVLGTTAGVTSFGGIVALTGSSNGYGINTYTGGTTFNTTRAQIGGDTLYSGLASSPTIISGPFGTGAMTWTSGEGGNGFSIEAVGGPRTIVNAFNATSSAANANFRFMGHEALTFTRNWDINSDGTLRNRTLITNNTNGPVTFSGNLSNSGVQGSNLLKQGVGLLVLSGTNTQANLLTTDGNYGTGVFIDSGILRVGADAALGSSAALAAAGPHLLGPADVRLRGGVLSVSNSFTTARQLILTLASGIDVASGQTLTVSTQTAGAFGLTKTGPGTLALNNSANTITTLTLGGQQQLNPASGYYSHTGGTVSTTATSGTPFAATSATLNSGTLSLVGGAVAQALTIPTINYGAAGAIALNQGTTTSQLTASTAFVRQGAFNSVNYGTLTLNPSALVNLGATEKLIVSAGAPTNTALGSGSALTTPSVFVALAGSGQDANFTRYDVTNGFMAHNADLSTSLAITAPATIANITAADTVGAAPNDIIDVFGLRTDSNVSGFDSSVLLRLNGGGLILNGATGPVISSPVLFGTGSGSGLVEAITYVRDGQASASIISGNVSARDFTKTGPGVLELSGSANTLSSNATRLPVLSVQNGTLRFASTGAQFSNANRPLAINAILGNYVLNVNENGVFDLNGLPTAVSALTGNGSITSNVAGAVTLTSRNGFGIDTTFAGTISNGSGTVGFTKTGNGILTLTGHNSYTGGTIVEAGRVTNAVGSPTTNGRLEAQKTTGLGTGPITLAGGTLTLNATTYLNSAQTTNEVSDGIDVLLWGGPNGYDITIGSSGITNGVALPANTSSTLNAGTQNALIGSLTVNAPLLTSTAGLIFVKGASTFSQANTVIRTAGGRVFLQGQVNAAGNTITKTGANDLVISHTESATQNTAGLWKVYGGILNARSADGAANPLGANPTVEINGGSTNYGLLLNTDGDGTAATERVTTYANTTVRFGSPLPVSSSEFVMSSSGRLGVDRILGNNDDKTIVVGALEIRGALGTPSTLFINGNRANTWVEGSTNFQRDWQIEINPGLDTAVTLNGVVSGNGTLNRKGFSGSLLLNNVNTWNGGMFINGGGNTILGSLDGNQVTLSDTAKFGTGHVFLGPLSLLQVNSIGNLRADQNYYVGGNLSWAATFGVASDMSLETVRLRSAGLGGFQVTSAAGNPSSTDYYLSNPNPSAAVLSLGAVYTQALNQRALGDGMWFIGSATNMVGANGAYDAATLLPGLDNNYRLGAGGSTLFLGTNGNANVLTDTDATATANLIVGAPMTVQNGSNWSAGAGTLVLLQNQNYTGSTIVNRNSTLDVRGTLTTSGIEVYGTLNVAGEAGTFINPNTSANIPVTLRPGSTLRFDNTSAGVLPATATQGRWEDSVGFSLNNAIIRIQGNPAVEVSETVGDITANSGTNQIQIVRGMAGRGVELVTGTISRSGNSTVQLVHNSSQLGTDERLLLGTAPTLTNGMVEPWMISATDVQFLTYNADTGFTDAGFDRAQAAATLTTSVTATSNRTLFTGNVVLNAGVDFETYALRLDGNVTLGTATDNTAQIIIGSGGLLSNGTRTITAGIVAGSIGTPDELLIYNNGTTAIGEFANPDTAGQVIATSITKFGAGTLQFLGNNAGFTGDIRIQQGTVELNYRNTAAVSTDVTTTRGGNGGNIIFEGAGTVLNLLAGQNGTNVDFTGARVTFNKSIVLADNLPVATIFIDRSAGNSATSQNKTIVLTGGITFGATAGDIGQLLRIDGRNGFDLEVDGTVTLNGRSSIAVENGYSGTATDVLFDGQVTESVAGSVLIKGPVDSKTRELTLRNVTSLNNWTGGTVLQGGTLRVYAKAPNVAAGASTDLTFGGISTGTLTLMQGLLDLRLDSDIGGAADTNLERVIYGDTVAPNVVLNGSTQINVDRTGLVAAGTTKQIVLGNLTMGQQWLTVTGGNSYSLEFGGTTSLVGNPYINNSADLTLNGAISTDGGGVIFNKTNTAALWINSANPTLLASTYINAGLLAFGNRLTGSTTANLGVGDIYINPGAAIQVRAMGNINTGAGQQVNLVGTPYAPSVFRAAFGATQAELQSLIASRTTTSNEVAVISWEATPAAANYDQSLIGDGRVFFGAIAGDRTYTGAATGSALIPGLSNLSNSVVGGTSTNRVYRLGGGDTTARTLNVNLTVGGLNDFGGNPTDLQVGSQAILGPNGNYSIGFVYLQDQNTYTGQTIVARGHTLRFNQGMSVGNTAGPLGANGSALIDVYGGLRFEGTTGNLFQNGSTTTHHYTNINFHPTSTLTFQDMDDTGGARNRWADGVGINLDGSAIVAEATNNSDNNAENIGSVIFDRGSRVYLTQEGTGDAFLTAASVTRASASSGAGTGRGTLVFTPSNTATFGAAATAGVAQTQFISTAAITASSTSAVTGMLPGYYMESNGNRFVKNSANGITPVVDGDMVGMPTGAGAGNEVVNISATTTMGSFETSIFALRGVGNIVLNSPTGANNDATITLTGSGADVGAVVSTGTSGFVINPNLKFGASGTNEGIFYTGTTLTVNGNITAGSITKYGVGGTLVIGNDQSDAARGTGNGYQGGWVVNEGNIQFNTFGSAGNAHANNTIVLNGSQAGSAQLNLRAQPADTLLNYTYTSGKIYAVDFATIDWDPNADDRVHSIADLEIQQSGGIGNAPANGTLDAYLRVATNRSRSILSAGSLTVASNAILNVDTTVSVTNFQASAINSSYLSSSISSGLSVSSLVGSNRLTKWGDGTLYVRGNSPSFTGAMVIDQGVVHVTHNGSLGTGALLVNRYGVLDVGVANFAQTNSSTTYNEGSIERWSVDSARSGAIDLGKATLQIAANQPNTTAAVTLNGGGIQAFLRGDDIIGANSSGGVLRVLTSNVTFNLAGNSFIGDRYYEGANGLDSGDQTNDNRPMEEFLASGAILEVQGVISGTGGLTKVGYDTVILTGANTYSGGTVITGGKLMIGADNALPQTGTLSTTGNGVLDLNGQNQTVGTLTNVVTTTTTVNNTSGFITNSGTTNKTLTVGNGVSTDFSYAGVIQHNVALTKTGTAVMTLQNANTYMGNTVITGGTLALGANGSISDSPWINVQGAAAVLDVNRGGAGYTFDGKVSGGGIDGVGTTYATVANAAKINGSLTLADHIAEVSGQGTMAPGASSNPASLATAGDALGHIYTNGNLTVNGPLVGTVSTAVDRIALQITTATVNAATLPGTFDYTGTWLTTNAASYLTSTSGSGSLAGHDYINVGGTLTLNQYGRVTVSNLGAGTYAGGDVFNLLDWTSLTNNGFTVNGAQYDGSGDSLLDLDLPTLSAGLLWDTSLFLSHGVVFVVPEPSRAMLLLFGLLGLMMRRRRKVA